MPSKKKTKLALAAMALVPPIPKRNIDQLVSAEAIGIAERWPERPERSTAGRLARAHTLPWPVTASTAGCARVILMQPKPCPTHVDAAFVLPLVATR